MQRPDGPLDFTSPDALVEWTLSRVGKRVVLGTPLALGKLNQLVNAFYRRAEQDPSITPSSSIPP